MAPPVHDPEVLDQALLEVREVEVRYDDAVYGVQLVFHTLYPLVYYRLRDIEQYPVGKVLRFLLLHLEDEVVVGVRGAVYVELHLLPLDVRRQDLLVLELDLFDVHLTLE